MDRDKKELRDLEDENCRLSDLVQSLEFQMQESVRVRFDRSYWLRTFAGQAMQMVYHGAAISECAPTQAFQPFPPGWKIDFPVEAVSLAEALLSEIERREAEKGGGR